MTSQLSEFTISGSAFFYIASAIHPLAICTILDINFEKWLRPFSSHYFRIGSIQPHRQLICLLIARTVGGTIDTNELPVLNPKFPLIAGAQSNFFPLEIDPIQLIRKGIPFLIIELHALRLLYVDTAL